MAVTKLWTDWALKLHTKTAQAAAAVHVDGITDQGLNSSLQTRVEGSDGIAYNTYGALVSGAPVGRFTTNGFKTLMDECGLTGMLIDADVTHPGVVMYFQKMAQGGTREAADGSLHISVTVANGLMVLRSVSLPHQGTGTVSGEIIARKSGATDPLTFDEAADLDDGVYPATDVVHTLGPVDFNGTTIDGLQNAEIDFGIALETAAADSDVYPTFVGIRKIQPSITLSGVHADVLATLTEHGVYYIAEQITLYAKKRDEGGTFVADGTAEHIKFTLGKSRVDWEGITGDPKSINMRITPWYTAGGSPVAPIAINTASAIT